MRKITVDVDTLKISHTGDVMINEVAEAGLNIVLSAVAAEVTLDGWESGEDALTEVCAELWRAFREERGARAELPALAEQENTNEH